MMEYLEVGMAIRVERYQGTPPQIPIVCWSTEEKRLRLTVRLEYGPKGVSNRWKVFFTTPIRYTILHTPFWGNSTNILRSSHHHISHGIGIMLSLPRLDRN
ncbi:hypothetical protein BT69DRAFT_1345118 [Atractiella rhizophila]|nr:hypothetical protein BT69DRAFT_1345118 [Atractiella rhizophila]